jgi:protein-S-isoprenylcysteine O-methyltransferase Ste14
VIHAVQDLFANEVLRRVLYRTRYLLFLFLLVPLALFMKPALLGPALFVSLVGQLIQTWCFASLVKNRELTTRGPYHVVRNPMYLGRFFLILGFVLLPGSLPVLAAFTVLYVVYMVSRVRREERRLARVFGERYGAYCRNVKRFVPSLRRLADPEVWCFDRRAFLENHAHWNIVLTVAAYGILWIQWEILHA